MSPGKAKKRSRLVFTATGPDLFGEDDAGGDVPLDHAVVHKRLVLSNLRQAKQGKIPDLNETQRYLLCAAEIMRRSVS